MSRTYATLGSDGVLASAQRPTAADLSAMRRYATSIGDGIATSIAVTHNLGTLDVSVQCYEIATGLTVTPLTITRTNTNTATLTFTIAPTSASVRVIVVG